MIALRGLTKRYGATTAVDDVTLDVVGGKVTGFLGPNGAGKSTTMRIIVGLERPSAGVALVDGVRYETLAHPLRKVGTLLDAAALHPGRSARNHLVAMAHSNGIPSARVDEVLGVVGLDAVGPARVGTFSLGMRQRLGIAGALLGDPEVLLFDEPVNGLDVDGVRWIRQLMRELAAEGRTVFVSSHLMSEMEDTAHHLVVIGRGRLIVDAPTAEVIAGGSRGQVAVRSPDRAGLEALSARLVAELAQVRDGDAATLLVSGATSDRIGDLAHELGVRLHELSPRRSSLEDAYLQLTADSVEYGVAS